MITLEVTPDLAHHPAALAEAQRRIVWAATSTIHWCNEAKLAGFPTLDGYDDRETPIYVEWEYFAESELPPTCYFGVDGLPDWQGYVVRGPDLAEGHYAEVEDINGTYYWYI